MARQGSLRAALARKSEAESASTRAQSDKCRPPEVKAASGVRPEKVRIACEVTGLAQRDGVP